VLDGAALLAGAVVCVAVEAGPLELADAQPATSASRVVTPATAESDVVRRFISPSSLAAVFGAAVIWGGCETGPIAWCRILDAATPTGVPENEHGMPRTAHAA
jgi:hypothetical protein